MKDKNLCILKLEKVFSSSNVTKVLSGDNTLHDDLIPITPPSPKL